MTPAKLKGILSSLVQSRNPVFMHPSLFKVLWSLCYWLWVSYPMGECSLILKGGIIRSAVLVATVKVPCGYCRVYHNTMYCAVWYLYTVMSYFYLGCMRKRITLHLFSSFQIY